MKMHALGFRQDFLRAIAALHPAKQVIQVPIAFICRKFKYALGWFYGLNTGIT